MSLRDPENPTVVGKVDTGVATRDGGLGIACSPPEPLAGSDGGTRLVYPIVYCAGGAGFAAVQLALAVVPESQKCAGGCAIL